MVRIAPIKMQVGPKVLWFDPVDLDIKAGDKVVVTTERGTEFGTATADIMEVSDELVEQIKSPLKPVLRIATEEDIQLAAELTEKGNEALTVFKQFAAQTNGDDMHPVMVEFLLDGDKAIFYFEAEDRVDFRNLVRQLAAHFHVRVDMRQIGVRDGARIVGGLGHCGQELCCKRLGGEFSPVSIKMAKEQNLSLNPQKISGVCGRLMCCLRYEYEAYKEVNSRAPKNNAKIEVPGGYAKVTEINVPLERITLLLEDGKTIKVPLSEMEIVGEGKRPNKISQEVYDKYTDTNSLEKFETSAVIDVATFTHEDKLAPAPSVQRKEESGRSSGRRPRRRRSSAEKARNAESKPAQQKDKQPSALERAAARANQTAPKGQKAAKPATRKPRGAAKQAQNSEASAGAKPKRTRSQSARRPGQKSSGIRNANASLHNEPRIERKVPTERKGAGNHKVKQQNNTAVQSPKQNNAVQNGEIAHRTSRRRRHKAGKDNHEN